MSYFGGGKQGGIVFTVKNVSANAIPRGTVVSISPDADRSYATVGSIDRSVGYGTQPTIVIPVVPWVTSTADRPVGVSVNRIASGDDGDIIVAGVGLVETNGSVAAGNDLMVTTGGLLILSTTGNIVRGQALCDDFALSDIVEYGTTPTNTYVWAILNFLKHLTTP
jgi:hypothetical protein